MTGKKKALVVDAQGGGLGAQLVRRLLEQAPEGWEVLCVGANVQATGAMLKAGAARGATGENALLVNAAQADLILGPIGIILANGIMGEISPAMAAAVSGAGCTKVLVPSNSCGVYVAGTEEYRLEEYIRRAVDWAVQCMRE